MLHDAIQRTMRALVRRGLLIEEEGTPYLNAPPDDDGQERALRRLQAASVDAGRIRILALVDPARTAYALEIRRWRSSGLPGYDAGGWGMLLAPGGTPPEILARLNAEARRAYAMADMRDALERAAIDPMLMSPEESREFLRKQFEKWGKLIKDIDFKPQ